MNKNFVCEFCNCSFSTKSNLTVHKKRAKKCLFIQNKETEELFKCNYCNKNFTKKQTLQEHNFSCKAKIIKIIDQEKKVEQYESIIIEKDEYIKKLEKQIEKLQDKLADKNTTNITINITNNNNIRINNKILNQLSTFDLTKENVENTVNEKFNKNYLLEGEDGVTGFAVNYLLTNDDGKQKLICTDVSRKIFHYKDENNKVYKDPGAVQFADMYLPALKKKSCNLVTKSEDETNKIEIYEVLRPIIEMNATKLSNELSKNLVLKPE